VRFIERSLEVVPGDIACVCVHTREHVIARMLSRRNGLPLYCIMHDLWPADAHDEVAKTLRHSESVFSVSTALRDLCVKLGAKDSHVLLPIAEEFIDEIEVTPPDGVSKVGIAGSLHEEYVRAGTRVADKLIVVGPRDVWSGCDENITFVPRLKTNRDALAYLGTNCNALLVHLSFETSAAYSHYAFPSKLGDFSHTGLPLIVSAPEDSTLGQWAKQNDWKLWLKNWHDMAEVDAIRALLLDQENWHRESARTKFVAETQFDPKATHEGFASKLK
jgi:hypothetical protein